jgi:hypothetical protein
MTYTYCRVCSNRLLMMDRETVRNMYSTIPKINLRNSCISLVLLEEASININSNGFIIHYECSVLRVCQTFVFPVSKTIPYAQCYVFSS